jgi:hypothetical protein
MNGKHTAHTEMARVLAFAISAIGDRNVKQTWDALFRDIFRRSICEDFLESGQELQVASVRPRSNPVGDSYRPQYTLLRTRYNETSRSPAAARIPSRVVGSGDVSPNTTTATASSIPYYQTLATPDGYGHERSHPEYHAR